MTASTVDRAVSAQAEQTINDHVAFLVLAGDNRKDAATKVRAFWAATVADDAVAAALGRPSLPTLTGMTVDCYRAACALTEATR